MHLVRLVLAEALLRQEEEQEQVEAELSKHLDSSVAPVLQSSPLSLASFLVMAAEQGGNCSS